MKRPKGRFVMRKTLYIVSVLLLLLLVATSCSYIPSEISSELLPRIDLFEATQAAINQGEVTYLRWSVSNASSVSIDNGIGNVALNGTILVSPEDTTFYTLTAKNFAGQATARTQVIVKSEVISQPGTGTLTSPTIVAFYAEHSVITPNQDVRISWKVVGATDITLEPLGKVSAEDTITVSQVSTTTYILTATNAYGKSTAGLTIAVQPSPSSETSSQAMVVLNELREESGSLLKVTGSYLNYHKYDSACAGDNSINLPSRAFLSFDISSIPEGAIIQEAVLDFGDYIQMGDPSYTRSMWGNMGKLEIYNLQYGGFDDLGFASYSGAGKLVAETEFKSYPALALAFDVRYSNTGEPVIQNLVRDGASRCQFRVQFFTSTNWDGVSDMLCFDNASLSIKYSVP